jgi:hypothetical protein
MCSQQGARALSDTCDQRVLIGQGVAPCLVHDFLERLHRCGRYEEHRTAPPRSKQGSSRA